MEALLEAGASPNDGLTIGPLGVLAVFSPLEHAGARLPQRIASGPCPSGPPRPLCSTPLARSASCAAWSWWRATLAPGGSQRFCSCGAVLCLGCSYRACLAILGQLLI